MPPKTVAAGMTTATTTAAAGLAAAAAAKNRTRNMKMSRVKRKKNGSLVCSSMGHELNSKVDELNI